MRNIPVKLFVTLLLALGALGLTVRSAVWPNLARAQAQTQEQTQERPTATSQASTDQTLLLEDERNTVEIVERYGPSVVAVTVTIRGQTYDPFGQFGEQLPDQLRPFFQLPQGQPREFTQQASGSGFVVSEDGDIITNFHVVAEALEANDTSIAEGSSITVTFPGSDREYPVEVVGANAIYDLALLRLTSPEDLPSDIEPIPLADSDQIKVGQKVIAIGNPFGFASTVTTGIVSGVGRSLPGVGEVDIPLIQTDAAINPGNSGGPLLNSRGELIGVNTAIIPSLSLNGQRGNIGIGFAVPSNLLERTLAELRQGGFTDISSRPRLGITIIDVRAFPESVREQLNLPEQGVSVQSVEPGSAAEAAGIRGGRYNVEVEGQQLQLRAGGDIILAVDGVPVTSAGQLQDIILGKQAGDTVTLTIWRDGEELEVPVTLSVVGDQRDQSQQQQTPSESGPRLGVSVQDVSSYPETVRRSLGLPDTGAVVVAVQPGSAAERAGLRGSQFTLEENGQRYPAGGDVITAVDGEPVESAEALANLIRSKQPGDTVTLTIYRDGEEQTVTVTLQETSGN